MDKKQIEREIAELKMEYVNLQGDIEKLESVGQNRFVAKSEVRLGAMEEKLAMLNKKLAEFES
ncbi:SE1832 family protein [Sporosarcina sp. 6E9]|uniref:SE1832 family protein n=2 Tax=Sporosarcina TaxID=1569 RepID=UPI001B3101DE|nr:SE1832 family protein [Sporosarcina sp. 6E9]